MDIAATLTGITAILSGAYKLLTFGFRIYKFNKKVSINLQNHQLFIYTREWKHNVIKIKHPSRRKEEAIKRLIYNITDAIDDRARQLIENIKSNKKFKCDIVKWHMDTIDAMYKKAIENGLPSQFIDKFKMWSADEEHALLESVKRQKDGQHLSFAHMVDDVLKDYIMALGMIFNNVERLKDDFLTKLNGELDKILDQ